MTSASPKTSVCSLHTHRHSKLRGASSALSSWTDRLRPRRRDLPKVTWQTGLDPRPPNQLAPFLTWQLAPPAHLCSGLSPLSFPKGACPIHFNAARIWSWAGTPGCRKVREALSRVSKSSGRKIPMGSRVQAKFPKGGGA